MKCTYCDGTKFYEGPSGGMSVNVLCANDKCRHWFNSTPFGLDDLKRIEPTKEEKTTAETQRHIEIIDARLARQVEGVKAFNEGRSIQSLRTSKPYGGYSEAADNLDRICGFMDAAANKIRQQDKS